KTIRMKLLTHFSRFFVGVLFIFSGVIKLNDPVGFSFKLDEYFSEAVFNMPFLQQFSLALAVIIVVYFSEAVFNMPFLQQFSLALAVIIVVVEIILGVMLLLGYLKRTTLWLLLLMIVFFTFLTFYSAYFNKVTDCGCFGDAIPLTPW